MVIRAENGTPILLRDVAVVREGGGLRQGAATHNGKETVVGVAMMLRGANSRAVAVAVDKKIKAIRKTLPPDVRLATVYNRTELVDKNNPHSREKLDRGRRSCDACPSSASRECAWCAYSHNCDSAFHAICGYWHGAVWHFRKPSVAGCD